MDTGYQKRLIPKFPTAFLHTSPTAALHTESTTNLSTEEALSNSWVFERDPLMFGESPERKSNFSGYPNKKRIRHKQTLIGIRPEDRNPLLRTQPVKKLASPLPEHTHTKSYDISVMNSIPIQMQTAPFV